MAYIPAPIEETPQVVSEGLQDLCAGLAMTLFVFSALFWMMVLA